MNASILIVDDNPINLKLASDVLEVHGFSVAGARSAEDALTVMEENAPQLVLMDIGLPGMDGLTLTRRLRSDPRYAGLKIVALTAFAMKGDDIKALQAGCDGYISKPINTRTFAAQVEAYFPPALADVPPGQESSA
jgi:CheY-like chemotaxis protein